MEYDFEKAKTAVAKYLYSLEFIMCLHSIPPFLLFFSSFFQK